MLSQLVLDDRWNECNMLLSKDYLLRMQNERYKVFKNQDLEKGFFDVTFEIEGKKLYAHKFTIATISETLTAMLSDRWTTKDEPVKIETYSYDVFYEFLCFVYTGCCKLTSENIFHMTDIAEFYAVPFLKEFCDKFLSDKNKTAETIEEMFEMAKKYSLPKLLTSIKDFARLGNSGVYDAEKFCDYKKSFVEFLSTAERDPDYVIRIPPFPKEGEFFECVYKWAEKQALMHNPVDDDNFDLQKSTRTELYTIIPYPALSKMSHEFLMNFVIDKGFFLSPDGFDTFYYKFQARGHSDSEENLFKSVSELAEKQAMKKQMMAQNNENFNLANTIKADLTKVISRTEFYQMDKQFLKNFVVAKGIITDEQANHLDDTVVKISLTNGNFVSGAFKDDIGIRKAIQNQGPTTFKPYNTALYRFTRLKFSLPTTPSTVTRMKGVNWYLCLEMNGILSFKNYSAIQNHDYLLAEMKSNTEFQLILNQKTHLTTFYKNLYEL